MASASTVPDYEKFREELARTIRKHRDDCPPFEMARQLLEYENPGHTTLIGVNSIATRAFLYHDSNRYIVAVDFGPNGLADACPVLADFKFGSNIYSWVQERGEDWGWLNPRFR